jgi:hypothetical protein
MSQSDKIVLMARLASDGFSMRPSDAIWSLASLLDRLRSSLEDADYQELLLIGASIWRLASMQHDLQRPLLAGSGGTG